MTIQDYNIGIRTKEPIHVGLYNKMQYNDVNFKYLVKNKDIFLKL